jgi:hypothetical protein
VLLDFTGVLGVLLPLHQPTVGVGRSRYGRHDGAEDGGWACGRGGLSLIGSSGVRRSHEQALNPEQVLKPTIGGKADRDRRCGRSFRTRLADRRGPRSNDGLWDERLSASNAIDAHPPSVRIPSTRCIL